MKKISPVLGQVDDESSQTKDQTEEMGAAHVD